MIDSRSFDEMYLPHDHFRSLQKYENLGKESALSILQKYAILSFLVSDKFIVKIAEEDYFSETIFDTIIRSEFRSRKQVFSKFMDFRSKIQEGFNQLQSLEIDRLVMGTGDEESNEEVQRQGLNYSQKLQTLLTDLVDNSKKPDYVTCQFQAENQKHVMLGTIFRKIEDILFAEHATPANLSKYRTFLKGELTEGNLQLVKALFAKANTELGFFKLPFQFESQKHVEISSLIKSFISLPTKSNLLEDDSLIDVNYSFKELDRRLDERMKSCIPNLDSKIKDSLSMSLGGKGKVQILSEKEADELEQMPSCQKMESIRFQLNEDGNMILNEEQQKKFGKMVRSKNLDFIKMAEDSSDTVTGNYDPRNMGKVKENLASMGFGLNDVMPDKLINLEKQQRRTSRRGRKS